jgi:hypothetical protein
MRIGLNVRNVGPLSGATVGHMSCCRLHEHELDPMVYRRYARRLVLVRSAIELAEVAVRAPTPPQDP